MAAAGAAGSLEAGRAGVRGLRGSVEVSEGPECGVDSAEASARGVAGHLAAVRVPEEAETGPAGVTGGGQGAPGGAGGGVEAPGESARGWESPGSPGDAPSGPADGEVDAGAPEGSAREVCVSDKFVPKRSCRRGSAGLAGGAAGGPGQELQLTGAAASPRGLLAPLPDSRRPRRAGPCPSSAANRNSGQEEQQSPESKVGSAQAH